MSKPYPRKPKGRPRKNVEEEIEQVPLEIRLSDGRIFNIIELLDKSRKNKEFYNLRSLNPRKPTTSGSTKFSVQDRIEDSQSTKEQIIAKYKVTSDRANAIIYSAKKYVEAMAKFNSINI